MVESIFKIFISGAAIAVMKTKNTMSDLNYKKTLHYRKKCWDDVNDRLIDVQLEEYVTEMFAAGDGNFIHKYNGIIIDILSLYDDENISPNHDLFKCIAMADYGKFPCGSVSLCLKWRIDGRAIMGEEKDKLMRWVVNKFKEYGINYKIYKKGFYEYVWEFDVHKYDSVEEL